MEMIRIVWTVFVLSSVYSLPVVQISTCDAPVANLSLSICCFTEILPGGERVVFFNNSIPVASLSQSCELLHDNQEVTSSCSMRDNVSVFSIVFPGQNFASDGGHNTWSCKFYGFKAEMTITVLDSHKYIKQSPGSTAMLQYVLNDTASLNGSIRVYNLQQNHTVLKVDLNNTVIFEENRIDYIGNVKRKNFSLHIESISTEDRGTYICQYRIETIPNIFRHAITLLVPEKPPKPTVNKGNEDERVMSAELACTANSGYAAPLFYIPQLETRWIYQPYDTSSYTILTNGSTAYISAVNCTRETLPAVKCYVENDVGRSEDSEEFSPHSMLLDSHKYIKQSPGSTAMLQYVLNDTASLNGSIRVYNLQQNHTVLKVDLNNTVIFEENRIDYIGNVKRKNFSLQIESISTEDRGTYICQYRIGTIPNIFRHAITLLVPEKPPKPTVNKGNEDERVMSAELACTANSGYAAPLFYIPQLETRWIYQPYDTSSYTILTNGSTAYISAVNCTRETLPAVKYYVENDVGRSEDSEEFSPHSMCFDDSYQPAGSDDYYQPAGPDESNQSTGSDDTKIVFVFLGVVGFCFCLLRSVQVSTFDSNSDRDVRRSECDSRRILFDDIVENPWRRLRDDMPALADGLRDHRPQSLEMEQTLERIATEESRQNYERQYNRVRDYRPHSLEMQQALERIAMEESRLNNERQYNRGTFHSDDSSRTHAGESSSGRAVGGDSAASTGAVRRIDLGQRGATRPLSDDISVLREVETLIQQHHDSLGRNVIRLQISRDRIVENVLAYYTEKNLALARVTVKMVGEDGRDCGGVSLDMYTTFWSRVQEQFFIGCERVVPELQAHRYIEEPKFRVLGRILSHSIAVMKTFPIKMCKSTIIAMIYDTTEVAADTLPEDFLYFVDDHERTLVTSAINHYSSLTTGQVEELAGVFERFNYGAIPTEDTFKHHVTQLARHVTCIRPRTLLELMRSGIPQPHFEHFWSRFHINTLDVLFKVLRPTADRVIARLKVVGGYRDMTRCQTSVLEFLKDLLHEMSQPELETFLHFVTEKKSIPQEKITIQFTTETGAMWVPKAHTCSSMLELPETYENYSTFRSELKHILASEEALTMTMA